MTKFIIGAAVNAVEIAAIGVIAYAAVNGDIFVGMIGSVMHGTGRSFRKEYEQ